LLVASREEGRQGAPLVEGALVPSTRADQFWLLPACSA